MIFFMATDSNLLQQLQFSCHKVNFERKKNEVVTKTLSRYEFFYDFNEKLDHDKCFQLSLTFSGF